MKKILAITVYFCVFQVNAAKIETTSFKHELVNVFYLNNILLNDTIKINTTNLLSKKIALGKSNYIVYAKKGKDAPAMNITFVEIDVVKEAFNDKKAYKITQKWSEKDTLLHTSETILNENNLATLYHKTWWKKNNQVTEVDYTKKTFSVTGEDEKFNKRAEEGLKSSFLDTNFINWHSDLHLFPLLPFKEAAIFKVNVYDPGYSPPREEIYTVIGSEKIEGNDCWILNFELPNNMGYQRFWVSKSDKIIIKEEDNFRGNYRYKLKTITGQ